MTKAFIPLDKLASRDASIIQDELFSHKALTDPAHMQAVEDILEAKMKDLKERSKAEALLPDRLKKAQTKIKTKP
jgi:hypothetical protein